MSRLRRVKKSTTTSEEDVEALTEKGSRIQAAIVFDAPSEPKYHSPALFGSTRSPAFRVKFILRKVVSLLAGRDDATITNRGGFVKILGEIMVSVILGVITVYVMVFLDHRDIARSRSANNFRNAAFRLLNDPETIANVEELSDFRVMLPTDFDSKRDEIGHVAGKMASLDKIFAKRQAEAEEKTKEIEAIRDEYNSLMDNPLLEMNKYCGGCSWSGKQSCDARVQYLQATYDTKLIVAKINAMEHPSCKKE